MVDTNLQVWNDKVQHFKYLVVHQELLPSLVHQIVLDLLFEE